MSGEASPPVYCVLRAGRGFNRTYPVKLWEGVREHWEGELDFRCLTDTEINHPDITEIGLEHPWGNYWCKLELFRPDLKGPMLYFDLDTMIVGSLRKIQNIKVHAMLRAYKWKYRLASGMMSLPEAVRPVIWDRWILDPAKWMRVHKWPNPAGHLPGDQGFLQETWERSGWGGQRKPDRDWQVHGIRRLQKMFPGQILSYKKHIRKKHGGRVPPNCRVVCFHGKPRPHQFDWRLPRQ